MNGHRFFLLVASATALASLHAPPARAVAEAPLGRALEFEIRGGLANFDGGTASVRFGHGEHAIWRFGLGLDARRTRVTQETLTPPGPSPTTRERTSDDRFVLSAQLTRLSVPWPERQLRPWYGLAVGGRAERRGSAVHVAYSLPDGTPTGEVRWSQSRLSPTVYTAALVGLEYSPAPEFALHAQYGFGVQYRRAREKVRYQSSVTDDGLRDTDDWQQYSTGARFGVAVFW